VLLYFNLHIGVIRHLNSNLHQRNLNLQKVLKNSKCISFFYCPWAETLLGNRAAPRSQPLLFSSHPPDSGPLCSQRVRPTPARPGPRRPHDKQSPRRAHATAVGEILPFFLIFIESILDPNGKCVDRESAPITSGRGEEPL
jgi:hypothetical protein